MKRTELRRLPEDLIEGLRETAHKTRCSLNTLIVQQLSWMNREQLIPPERREELNR